MACQKVSYTTQRAAAAAARAAGRRSRYKGEPTKDHRCRKSRASMRAYHCPTCGEWHLTSQPKRSPRRNQSRQEDV